SPSMTSHWSFYLKARHQCKRPWREPWPCHPYCRRRLYAAVVQASRPHYGKSLHHRKNVVFRHDQVFFAFDGDFVARIRREQNAIALLHLEASAFAVFQELSVAQAQHFALTRLLLGGVGENDAAGGLFLGFETLDYELVVEWHDF